MKIGVTNICGKMGKSLMNAAQNDKEVVISAGLSRRNSIEIDNIKVTNNIEELINESEILIDFSNPSTCIFLLDHVKETRKKIPIVIGTTGFSDDEKNIIQKVSNYLPIVQDYNMSLGINLICSLLPKMIEILHNFDIDISDKHHRHKIDSPSGTAKKILNIIKGYGKSDIYNEKIPSNLRSENSVGVTVTRAGGIFGEHEISFTSQNENIKISHTAFNRELFAHGAIKAAKWLIDKPAGLYSMKNVLDL